MGELELNKSAKEVTIFSHIIHYGDSASETLSKQFCDEVETLWNEAEGSIVFNNDDFRVLFRISGEYKPALTQREVLENTNPQNNYFRIEDFSPISISWVDGIGSNTGYMLIDNLYQGSTTAAHEYGHTIGLDHPQDLNLIGRGTPGIMYPRGTLVDPDFQYNPKAVPGENGGTIHPIHRRVTAEDILLLKIPELLKYDIKYIGKFTSVFHEKISKPIV